jgi:hypothetical protein
MVIRGESIMRQENEFQDRPIERSVIMLGIISGAILYISVVLFAFHLFTNASGLDPFWLATSVSG